MKRKHARRELARDIFFILIGASIAIILSRLGFVDFIVDFIGNPIAASFFTGILFTSVFTVAPASVAFAHIGEYAPTLTVAIWGGFGAMCGDVILFFFIRDRFMDDLMGSIRPKVVKHILNSFHLGFMKWLSPLLGAFIIASPFPDEFGLTLMGLSKVRLAILLPIAIIMNTIGIYSIVWLSHVI